MEDKEPEQGRGKEQQAEIPIPKCPRCGKRDSVKSENQFYTHYSCESCSLTFDIERIFKNERRTKK
jgi:transposase-like protein